MELDSATIGRQLEEIFQAGLSTSNAPPAAAASVGISGPTTSTALGEAAGHPPYYASSPSVARRDPYLLATPPAAGEVSRPEARVPDRAPAGGGPPMGPSVGPILPMDAESIAAVRALKARVGIKESTKTGPRPSSPHTVSHADKLQEARRSALRPFGIPGTVLEATPVPTAFASGADMATGSVQGRPPGEPSHPGSSHTAIDLESDELSAAFPGLGRLDH